MALPHNFCPTFGEHFSFAALDIHPHRRYVVDIGGRRSCRCRLHINFALFMHSLNFTQNLGVTLRQSGWRAGKTAHPGTKSIFPWIGRPPDDPARHGGPAQCYPQLFPCCFLPVQRHGIHILLVHDFCQIGRAHV